MSNWFGQLWPMKWVSRRDLAEVCPDPSESEPAKPPGEGWRLWQYQPPQVVDLGDTSIEIWREGWRKTHDCMRSEVDPMTNVIGLYWRPRVWITIDHERAAAQGRLGAPPYLRSLRS